MSETTAIIIVTYNTSSCVEDLLDSINKNLVGETDFHVFVVDNTCGRDAKQLTSYLSVQHFKFEVNIIISEKNGGFSYGNNLGITSALDKLDEIDYFWLLNPDTLVHENSLTSLISLSSSKKNICVLGSKILNGDGSEWNMAFKFPSILSEIESTLQFGFVTKQLKNHIVAREMKDEIAQVNWISGCSFFLPSAVYYKIGSFDENYFLYYEETDYCYRCYEHNIPVYYNNNSVITHLIGQSTGINEKVTKKERLPDYLYKSRCYYFLKNKGFYYTLVLDLVRLICLFVNRIKSIVKKQKINYVKYQIRDSISNLVIFNFNKFKKN